MAQYFRLFEDKQAKRRRRRTTVAVTLGLAAAAAAAGTAAWFMMRTPKEEEELKGSKARPRGVELDKKPEGKGWTGDQVHHA